MKNTKELIETLKVRLAETIKADATLGSDIEKLHTLFAEAVVPPAETPVAPKEFKTKDGVSLFIVGEKPEVGLAVFSDIEGVTPAADGEYIFEEYTIMVVGGLITEVKPYETEPEVNHEMAAKMEALSKENADLKANLELSNAKQSELVALFKRILDTPVDVKQTVNTPEPVSYDNMSKADQVRYNRGKL